MTESRPAHQRRRRILQGILSLAVVIAIFAFAFPKLADYSKVWSEITAMTWIELATLFAISVWNIVTYWFVMIAALPGSNMWQTMKINQASTAVANTLPGGGALGMGVTYAMYTAYGFSTGAIALAILVTGVWNNFVKLGAPIVALALVALQGDAGGASLVASLIGLAVLIAVVVLFWLTLRSDALARAIGARVGRGVSVIRRLARKPPVEGMADTFARFNRDAGSLVARRWAPLTAATLVSHLSLYLVLLVTLRHVGVSDDEVGWAQVLAAFAFVRLISALPITPGGLGVVELGLTAALISAGGDAAQVAAAVLVYRALTYLLPIPIGALLYVRWARGADARSRRLADARAADPPSELESSTP